MVLEFFSLRLGIMGILEVIASKTINVAQPEKAMVFG